MVIRDHGKGWILMMETEADSHRRFIAEYVAALKPDGMIEIQLAQRLAQDTWRINRIHAARVQSLRQPVFAKEKTMTAAA